MMGKTLPNALIYLPKYLSILVIIAILVILKWVYGLVII